MLSLYLLCVALQIGWRSSFLTSFNRKIDRTIVLEGHKTKIEMTDNTKEVYPISLKLVTFNVLAPCYKSINSSRIHESEFEHLYLDRNNQICNQLLETRADIICLQEYWTQSESIRNLYKKRLGSRYTIRELPRTSHWRTRDDGLAMFVNYERLLLQDARDIYYHDCGDRVAQLLLLALKPSPEYSHIPSAYHQFICCNTHLLFPHNAYSTNIRVREISKLLDFIESYRQRELCDSICGRSDVRIPVIIAGI
jgi:hypothetical protein